MMQAVPNAKGIKRLRACSAQHVGPQVLMQWSTFLERGHEGRLNLSQGMK